MTRKQIAALARRVERAQNELNVIADLLATLPDDARPDGFRDHMNLNEPCRCVPRLRDCVATLRSMSSK
jgi:hypothetical protein